MSVQPGKQNTPVDILRNAFKFFRNKKFVRYGLPFFILTLGGSIALKEWTQIRYQFSSTKSVSKEEAEKMGLHKDKNVTLENVFEEIKTLDIDNWENKRGPRPWEETEKTKH